MQAVKRLLTNQGINLAGRGNATHDGQVVPRLPFVDDRSQALWSVGSDYSRQQIEARFVHKNKGSALAARPLFQFGPDLGLPAFDLFFIPLHGTGNGNLRSPTQFLQQAGNVVFVIRDTELPLKYFGHPSTSPEFAPKSVGFRPVPKKVWNQALLSWRQLGRMARRTMMEQCIGAALSCSRQPLADSRLRDVQGLRNVPLLPTALLQLQRSQPSPLFPIMRNGLTRV